MSEQDPRQAPEGQEDSGALSHWGRRSSWLCIAVMIAGFTAAGIGLTLGPSWPWVIGGGVVFVLGGIAAWALGIVRDVVVDDS